MTKVRTITCSLKSHKIEETSKIDQFHITGDINELEHVSEELFRELAIVGISRYTDKIEDWKCIAMNILSDSCIKCTPAYMIFNSTNPDVDIYLKRRSVNANMDTETWEQIRNRIDTIKKLSITQQDLTLCTLKTFISYEYGLHMDRI